MENWNDVQAHRLSKKMAIFIIENKIIYVLTVGASLSLTLKIKSLMKRKDHWFVKPFLERVSLEGIYRIFNVSMPWLLQFIKEIIEELPESLNATVTNVEELEVAVVELDEQWSYVGNKHNQQWLWLVFHSATRQVLEMHVCKRTRQAAECLLGTIASRL